MEDTVGFRGYERGGGYGGYDRGYGGYERGYGYVEVCCIFILFMYQVAGVCGDARVWKPSGVLVKCTRFISLAIPWSRTALSVLCPSMLTPYLAF